MQDAEEVGKRWKLLHPVPYKFTIVIRRRNKMTRRKYQVEKKKCCVLRWKDSVHVYNFRKVRRRDGEIEESKISRRNMKEKIKGPDERKEKVCHYL